VNQKRAVTPLLSMFCGSFWWFSKSGGRMAGPTPLHHHGPNRIPLRSGTDFRLLSYCAASNIKKISYLIRVEMDGLLNRPTDEQPQSR
jgi:hypothetical protein